MREIPMCSLEFHSFVIIFKRWLFFFVIQFFFSPIHTNWNYSRYGCGFRVPNTHIQICSMHLIRKCTKLITIFIELSDALWWWWWLPSFFFSVCKCVAHYLIYISVNKFEKQQRMKTITITTECFAIFFSCRCVLFTRHP